MTDPRRVFTLLVLAALVSGCSFRRVESNRDFRALDTRALVVGESTWRDVLDTLGPPSGATTERIASGLERVTTFRYACADQKHTSFLFAVYLSLPFQWSDQQNGWELIAEFDPGGTLRDLYTVEEDVAWRPFAEADGRRVEFFGGAERSGTAEGAP